MTDSDRSLHLKVPFEQSGAYQKWVRDLKTRVQAARTQAVVAVNGELIRLYHDIGRQICEKQRRSSWGDKVIRRLASDLRGEFPEMRGFSERNLKYMKYFAESWPDFLIGQQPAARLPWFHIVTLMTKVSDPVIRNWYAQQSMEQAWSRAVLVRQIKGRLHQRQGAATTNFEARLVPSEARLAREILKDPYHFDFLGLGEEAHERDIESALVKHMTRFLLELGVGFAFLGRQYRLEVAGDEFFLDLLFYHTRLKCHVVVELKGSQFSPDQTGKLNFYLTAVDRQLKAHDDKPTIGLLLCRGRNKLVAEYALRGIDNLIGVAEYQLVRALPEELEVSLPTIEEIEAQFIEGDDE
jgi:predicted nuclease of restriction endonuclease-like (RecB) superfamily